MTNITDDQLADTELNIDEPDKLPGIVAEIPEDYLQAHIEFTYDLRGSGREEEFVCVHGHHRHLHGAVMRIRDIRFLVGWICAENIYGASLAGRIADYDARVSRRSAVLRVRELRDALSGFSEWAVQIAQSSAVTAYDDLQSRLRVRFPFVWETIERSNGRLGNTPMPRHLCSEFSHGRSTPLQDGCERLLKETVAVTRQLTGDATQVAAAIGTLHAAIEGLIRRAEVILGKLTDVELFFQPATLLALCEAAESSRPRRATHRAGVLKLTCRGEAVEMPAGFSIPARAAVDKLQAALTGPGKPAKG